MSAVPDVRRDPQQRHRYAPRTRQLAFVYLKHDDIALALLGVAVVLLAAQIFGELFRRARQPPVIGQVLAGILLGPSLLGHFSTALFPVSARPLLKVLATVGVVTFMFVAGLATDLHRVGRAYSRTVAAVGVLGTVVPFGLGLVLALALHDTASGVELWPFALFIGAAMSITAFPVLARILMERDLYGTPLASVTMASAAVDDVLTWATLALVVGTVTSSGSWDLIYIIGATALLTTALFAVVRPLLAKYADRGLTPNGFATAVAALLACSYLTATIGAHEIFGAFVLGAAFPRGRITTELTERARPLVAVLLPVFFVTTGLAVDFSAVGWGDARDFLLVLVVACAGKFLGAGLGARWSGLAWRESTALGVLMNTRGLTELIVLSIGRELGVLDAQLFTVLVAMAVVTTVATGPLLDLIKPDPALDG